MLATRMVSARLGVLAGLSLLAGCAAAPPARQDLSAQAVSYPAKVLAVRSVTAGGGLAPLMRALGQPAARPTAPAQEIVVELPDGSVKSLVPPPGVAPAALAPGMKVMITETPQMHMSLR
ncbi:hypothetical protein [Acidocella sp.]|uniref:hypothetical protein n=1 Tax=Acidocella sp. TaxID=50710 RepID=UPI003CFD5851